MVVMHRDTKALARRVRRLGGADAIVVDVVFTDGATIDTVADAVLDGLGKDPLLFSQRRRAIELASAWLGERHRDVLIVDAQTLTPTLCSETALWLSGMGVRPWFLLATSSPQVPAADADAVRSRLVEDFATTEVQEVDFFERFGAMKRPQSPVADDLPRLPRCDGLVFRSACRSLLSEEDFERVDRFFVDKVRYFHAAFANTEQSKSVHRIIRHAIDDTPSSEWLFLTVRAAQVACLVAGWRLTADTFAMISMAEVLPRRGRAVSERWWERLDAYRDPCLGAIAALYAHGVDVAAVAGMTVDDVVTLGDGTAEVQLATGPVSIPVEPARFLHAQVRYRHICGAADNDPLFTTDRAESVKPLTVTRWLRSADDSLGIAMCLPRVRVASPDPEEWNDKYGLTLEKLVRSDRGS